MNDKSEEIVHNRINLALLDPQRYGWTAGGSVADLLPPHEVRCCALPCHYNNEWNLFSRNFFAS